jgi:hypothetical protein
VNPVTLYPYIREPATTVSFNLALAQTPKTTSPPARAPAGGGGGAGGGGASTPATTPTPTPTPTPTRSALRHRIDIRPRSGTPATIRRVLFDGEGQQPPGPLPVMDSANGSEDDVASVSPALARCLQRFQCTGDDSVVVVLYHGPVDFLEDQHTFYAVFQNRKPFDPHWTDNPLVQQEMRAFATICGMYAFLRTVRDDYVGTVQDLSFGAICAIGEKLCTYHMEYTAQGKVHKCTPPTLYSKYNAHIFLLPEDSHEWGFTLHNIFSGSLTPKIRKGVHESKTYARLNFINLITHSDQCDALVLLKNEACLVWEGHKDQDERFREAWIELSGGNKNGSHDQAKPLQ